MQRFDQNAVPNRIEVERKLLDLIAGRIHRSSVADWANQFFKNDVEVADPKTWRAIVQMSGADLATTDRAYLHDERDFSAWLEELMQ